MPKLRHSSPDHFRRGYRGALAFAAAAALLAAAPAIAALYKWVDASGRVSYSDQPPPGNVKTEVVNAPAPPANPDAVRDMANQSQELKKRQAKAADDQKKADKARADAAQQREACTEARGQLKIYESNPIVRTVNEKGEPVYMDDTMKNKERARLQSMIRERCQG